MLDNAASNVSNMHAAQMAPANPSELAVLQDMSTSSRRAPLSSLGEPLAASELASVTLFGTDRPELEYVVPAAADALTTPRRRKDRPTKTSPSRHNNTNTNVSA